MIDQYPSANGVLTSLIWRKTAAGGETSLSGYDNASQALSYTPGQEQVYLNGILLVRGDDYTATNGTSITGLTALTSGDFVQINCYNNFSVATVPTTSLTGTIANNQLANSAITINGSAVSLGGSVTLAGDIESVTAGTGLTGGGTSGAVTLGLSTPVATTNGGTGLSTFTTGDIPYASSTNTLSKLGIGSTGQVLTVSGGIPSWANSSGKIKQIVFGSTTTSVTVNNSSTFVDTNLTATITPTSASSTILIMAVQGVKVQRNAAIADAKIRLMRDSTEVISWNGEFIGMEAAASGVTYNRLSSRGSFSYVDSPATTSAIVYKVQGAMPSATIGREVIFNDGMQSSIILMEIGA